MLVLQVAMTESFDDSTQEFVGTDVVELEFEHSLFTVSKWESKFKVPFLNSKEKTDEQSLWYVKTMCRTENPPAEIWQSLTEDHARQIKEYIEDSMTATWFRDEGNKRTKEIITSEIIYCWMTEVSIPFECEHWHLNRLLTLIRVCQEKKAPPKKLSRSELAARNRKLNAERRAQLGSRG